METKEVVSEATKYIDKLGNMLVEYGPRFLGAIAILIIGLWLASYFTRLIARLMAKRNLDPSLRPFLRTLILTIFRVLVIVSALGVAGIQMASFIAIIGAATLAVGLALQGTLQNFAGGVMILIFRPYKVGDWLEAKGYSGTVKEIQIFNTIIVTGDNRTVIIPNGELSNGSMINYSTEPRRRVDWIFGIGYGDDSDKAREVLMQLIKEDQRILADPEPFIAIKELGDSSVNFVVRVWVQSSDYWAVFFNMNEKVYKTFPKENLNIPFPQMDVHLQK
jgi:small conductance mechanosensitive channel